MPRQWTFLSTPRPATGSIPTLTLSTTTLAYNNGIKDTVQGYDAGPGWDACTGLGTPDGEAILARL